MRATMVDAEDRGASPIGRTGSQRPSKGMVVALIGPDGVGKSSQTARLTAILKQDYKCTALYLGSGDGGWRIRRIGKRLFRKLRDRGRPTRSRAAPNGKEFGTNHSLGTALSGVLSAIERYTTIRRAMRLAQSGSLVICDRWPQNLQTGFFDGPLRLAPHTSWAVRRLSRFESAMYRRMEKYVPDLAIHLVSDFRTSEARKPGDRTRADFEQRLALMGEMRTRDGTIKLVDAARGFDEVTEELLKCVSEFLDGDHVPKSHKLNKATSTGSL